MSKDFAEQQAPTAYLASISQSMQKTVGGLPVLAVSAFNSMLKTQPAETMQFSIYKGAIDCSEQLVLRHAPQAKKFLLP